MRRNTTIAVVIPALNEEEAVGKVLRDVPKWVDDVVVADNGSTDRTAEVARRHGARVVVEPRQGYGSACLAAIATLSGPDVVVFLDADHSDHPEEMSALVDPIIDDQADLVIGSRRLGRCQPGALTPAQRFGNSLACLLMRWFWGVRYTDLGPFRAIRFDCLTRLGMRDPNYGWTVEMQIKAARRGLRVRDVPVSYRARVGRSKVSGTIRGVVGAGTKILYTIFVAALGSSLRRARPPSVRHLIVFTRYPEPGKVKTRLIPCLGETGAAELQEEMTRNTLAWAADLERRGRVSLEVRFEGGDERLMRTRFGAAFRYAAQNTGDLGVRMARAVDEALGGGAESVVIVGTDCPALSARSVERAFDALRTHDLVLGPAHDGGYYLIGMREPIPNLFLDIPWGTSEVLNETLRRAARRGVSHRLLKTLRDVDRPGDLPVWKRFSRR